MVTDKKQLIDNLISQHRTLQADLGAVVEKIKGGSSGVGVEVVALFDKFKKDLGEHLELENGTFYPDYLEIKKQKGEDITDTQKFIDEMSSIGKVVMDFLGKYGTSEAVDSNIANFSMELDSIVRTLNLRIETEEEGVFDLYKLM